MWTSLAKVYPWTRADVAALRIHVLHALNERAETLGNLYSSLLDGSSPFRGTDGWQGKREPFYKFDEDRHLLAGPKLQWRVDWEKDKLRSLLSRMEKKGLVERVDRYHPPEWRITWEGIDTLAASQADISFQQGIQDAEW